MRPAVTPASTMLAPADVSSELKDLTLDEFRKYFKALVERTTTATGDITTYHVDDALVLGGLSWLSGMLGISRSAPAPGTAASPAGAPGSSAPDAAGTAGGGAAAPGGIPIRTHSLSNILSRPSITRNVSTPARSAILNGIDQEALRRELNALTGGTFLFTEGTVERWCDLAGIKEKK
jgi:hypothetical protein